MEKISVFHIHLFKETLHNYRDQSMRLESSAKYIYWMERFSECAFTTIRVVHANHLPYFLIVVASEKPCVVASFWGV
jgi:hypothetical protein